MGTSIKVRAPDKDRLDRLQAELSLRHGRKVTQQEVMHWLIAMGEANQDELGAPQGNLERLFSLPVTTGIRTREEDIDRDLNEYPA